MSAEIESMFSVREVPWHGLGTIVEEHLTAAEAIQAAELDWTVDKQPIFIQTPDGHQPVPRKFAVVRQTDHRPLGVVGRSYRPVQNREAFSFFDNLVDSGEAKYETAGSLSEGRVIWIMAKMPEGIQIGGVDPVDLFLLLHNRHDGTGSVTAATTPVRVVCQNTLNFAIKKAKRQWRVRHVGTLDGKLAEARQALELTFEYAAEFETLGNQLIDQPFTEGQLQKQLVKLADGWDFGEAARSALSSGVSRIYNGETLTDVAGTKWAAFNAVSEYFEHERKHGRTDLETKMRSTWFGDQRKLRQDALALLS